MTYFFQKFESSLVVFRAKWRFSVNLVYNILEPYNALVQIRLTTSKTKRDILLPHESPNELRLKTLGNQKILEKSQLLVET